VTASGYVPYAIRPVDRVTISSRGGAPVRLGPDRRLCVWVPR